MNFNFLVFPAPKPSYTIDTLANRLIWIPNYKNIKTNKNFESIHEYYSPNNRLLHNNSKELLENSKTVKKEASIDFMSPQQTLTKRFDFKNIDATTTKEKNKNNFKNKLENYEDLEEDSYNENPKNVINYETRSFDQKNAFSKYAKLQISKYNSNFSNSATNNDCKNPIIGYIPCLLMDSESNSDKIILFFHGNGEDIYLSEELIDSLFTTLNVLLE